jgi:hypothetical protein
MTPGATPCTMSALARAGVDVTLVVATSSPGRDDLTPEPFEVIEAAVREQAT